MLRGLLAVALCLSVAGCSKPTKPSTPPPIAIEASQPTESSDAPADPLAGLDADVEAVMSAFDVPGLAVVVVRDGETVLAKGYGTRTIGKDEPVDADTVFAIASNTKAFIATAVGLLVEEEKLGWDDRVIDHLPRLKLWDEYTTQHIRVRDLLCHRSGLSTWAGDAAWIGSKITTDELLARLRYVPPDHDFREAYGYTNLMFVVAGELIEAKSGQPWEAFVKARLLDPLGMARTTSSVSALPRMDNVATPHMEIDGELQTIEYLSVDNASAAGALNSSVADLAPWLKVQLASGYHDGKELIPTKVVEQMRVPHTPIPRKPPKDGGKTGSFSAYGLGWFLLDRHGAFVVTHGGGLPGMISRVTLVPDEGLGIAVLTNSETGAAANVANLVIDRYLGVGSRAELDRVANNAKTLAEKKANADEDEGKDVEPASVKPERLAGKYRHPLLGHAEVTAEDGKLRLDVVDHGALSCPLQHQTADTYVCRWDDPIFVQSTVTFDVQGQRAKALRFRLRPEFIDPLEYRFVRGR